MADSDTKETLGTTSNHPFWSVNRQDYVQAGSLVIGEQVQTFSGDTKRVISKLPRPGPEAVYNLEVHGEHVYYVGVNGVLVHNTGGDIYVGGTGVGAPKSHTVEVVLSRPQRNRTEGHWEAILDEVDAMVKSGDYKKAYANKGLAREVADIETNRRPDVWGVRHDGTIDQVEVPSKTDTIDKVIKRMKDNQRMLGDRAGKIKIVKPKKIN